MALPQSYPAVGLGAPSAKAAAVLNTTGAIYTLAASIAGSSFSLLGGSNANLSLAGNVISAAAAIGAGNSQIAYIREANAAAHLAEEYPVTLSVAAAPLAIAGTPASTGTVGAAYSFIPFTSGGVAPYTFALTGSLPAGLSFNTATGAITGTPTAAVNATGINITVTDSASGTASMGAFSIIVSAAPITLAALTLSPLTATAGTAWSGTISGKTAGSTITATSSDGTAITILGNAASGTFAAAGSPTITLTETLAGATNTPRTSTASMTVAPAATAPAPPTLGTPVAGNGTLTIPWTDGANGGSAITARYYSLGTSSGGEGALQAATITLGNLVLTGLTNGQTYYVEGYAQNAVGTSAPSSEVSGRPTGWILATSSWNDTGTWTDTANWSN